jgi:hypothetical protein
VTACDDVNQCAWIRDGMSGVYAKRARPMATRLPESPAKVAKSARASSDVELDEDKEGAVDMTVPLPANVHDAAPDVGESAKGSLVRLDACL